MGSPDRTKISQLFQKFLQPDFQIKNDTYLNRLLTHLSADLPPTDPLFAQWLARAVDEWGTQRSTPSPSIAAFALNVASHASKNEGMFTALDDGNFYARLVHAVKARLPEAEPSVKLGYIRLLTSFLEHKAGVRWTVTCDLWVDVLRLALTNQTVYIKREGCRFISKILEETIDEDENFCQNVVKQIMAPLDADTFRMMKTTGEMMEISEEIVYESLNPVLQLIGDVLEYFLESVVFAQNDCRIVLIFLRDFHLEQQICNFMMIAQNKYLTFDLGKIMFIMQFLEMYIGVVSNNLKMSNVVRKIMSIFTTNISKGFSENVLKLCLHGQQYWNQMGYKIPCCKVNKDNEPISFANQLLVLQLLPIFTIGMKYCGSDITEINSDEFRDQYTQKLFSMMCENTIRIAYSWRDFLVSQPDLFEISTKCLVYVMNSRKYYPRERAAIAFQAFVYMLKDIMRAIKESPENIAFFSRQINFFSLLFDAFVVFIEEFQITWRDSVETICVMALSFEFLSVPAWPTRLVVKALKLVNVSLVKYMSPNLALLVDRTNDSTLAVLGPLLVSKLYDITWEARDTALEVICTISRMSSTTRVLRTRRVLNNREEMEDCVAKYLQKVEYLLSKVLEGQCKKRTEESFDKLLVLFEQQKDKEVESALVLLPILTEWLRKAVALWSSMRVTPSTRICEFALNLTRSLTKDEERFCSLNSNELFFTALFNVLKVKQTVVAPSIKLSYVKVLSSFVRHTSGVRWTMDSKSWKDVHQLSLSSQSEEIVVESVKFLSEFLDKAAKIDEGFAEAAVRNMMLPLGENVCRSIREPNDSITREISAKYLKPSLRLIADILEYFLDGILFEEKDFQVIILFWKNFHLEERLSDFVVIARSECLAYELGRIALIMQLLELCANLVTNNISVAETDAAISKIKHNFLVGVSKGTFENTVKFCRFAQLFWRVVEKNVAARQIPNDCLSFSNELFLFEILPYFCLTIKYFLEREDFEKVIQEVFRDVFISKLFKMSCHEVIRTLYYWRDNLLLREDIVRIATSCNSYIAHAKKYITRDAAVVVVQSLIFHVKDLAHFSKQYPQKLGYIAKQPTYVGQILELLTSFIEEFEVTWKDSIESIDLLSFAFELSLLHEWPSDVIVLVLRLVKTAIGKYMAPNLALLLESTPDSDVSVLGPLLFVKLYNEEKEVRQAALEIVRTLAQISSRKTDLEICTEWVRQTVAAWCETGSTPRNNVLCFVLNLTGLLSKNECRFAELTDGSVLIKLATIAKIRSPKLAPEVMLAYVKLLLALLEHRSGVERIVFWNCWEDMIHLGLSNRNQREIVEWVSRFLEKIVDSDKEYCDEIVKQLLTPLNEAFLERILPEEFDDCRLKFVENILIHVMEGIAFERKNFNVALVFWKNSPSTDVKIFPHSFRKFLFIMQLIDLRVKMTTRTVAPSEMDDALTRIKDDFLSNISHENFDDVIDFCSFGLLYWKLMDSELGKTDETPFSNQLVVMFLLPLYSLVLKHFLPKCELDKACVDDEFRDDFVYKIINMRKNYISKRLFFVWRNRLNSTFELFRITRRCMRCMKELRKYFLRHQAVLIFQTAIYILKDIMLAVKKQPQSILNFRKTPHLVLEVFDLLAIFIEEFKITWTESFEAVDVMDVSFYFLSLEMCTTEVVVKILNLINIATREYMASSLVLMIVDSTLATLGTLMFSKLHDDMPEVQRGALEVVRTMACVSRIKFPSLQKVLMDSELPTLVVKMSTCDGESYVRATAIKCLQEMIQVEEIWNNALKTEDLPEKMRDILLNETEGIVRVEAATFMCVAYENQQFAPESLDRIYETMIASSTTDLHWEVKVRALTFWDKVIKNHLQNQGMIDDTFPNVTFSKEHRKIVTLTDSEIRKRLLKVLSQLSSIGGLGVLMTAVKDDCDLEVSKAAVKITQRLIDLFKKYNVRSDISTPNSPPFTENGMSAAVSLSSGISVDESMDSPASSNCHPEVNEDIIAQIVNAKDVSLLKNVYTSSDYGSVSKYDIQVRKFVTPNEFLDFCQQDLNGLINEKKNWLNGMEDLGSLLDDMLKTYEDDVNNMDCY